MTHTIGQPPTRPCGECGSRTTWTRHRLGGWHCSRCARTDGQSGIEADGAYSLHRLAVELGITHVCTKQCGRDPRTRRLLPEEVTP